MAKDVKPLGENEINDVLKNVHNFLGTYAIDELGELKISKYPVFIIINLDKRSGGGTHWVGLAIFDDDVYICDSLGYLMPNQHFPNELIKFLHLITFQRNLHITRKLQATNSNTCGYYTVLFVHMFSLKKSFNNFLNLFSHNAHKNDKLVISKVKKLF